MSAGQPHDGEAVAGPTQAAASLFSRNWGFVDPQTQERLAATTLFLAGVGLGSVIAELAVRTGIGGLILADGDTVATSNLNRQSFRQADVGRNKAEAVAQAVRTINPELRVQVIPRFLRAGDTEIEACIAASDAVIDAIDWDPAFLACHTAARAAGIPMLLPINLGWGSAVYLFQSDGPDLNTTFGLTAADRVDPQRVKQRIVAHAVGDHPSAEVARMWTHYRQSDAVRWPYDPQLGAAAYTTAALAVRLLVAVLGEQADVQPPGPFRIDLSRTIGASSA